MSDQELPKGWATAILSDLVAADGLFCDGDWVESKDQAPDGVVRLTQLADVGDGRWLDRSNRWMTEEKAKTLRCTYLRSSDILVARMPQPLGRACLFPGTPHPSVTVVDVAVVRPGAHSVESRWLMHALNSPTVRAQIGSMQAGTTRKRISRKNLGTVVLNVPPLDEQRRIVDELDRRLSHLDAALADLDGSTALLNRLVTSIREAVADGSLLSLESSDWLQTTTGEVAEVRGGIQKQPKRRPEDNAYPFLRVANVGRGVLDLSDVHRIELFDGELATYVLQVGDLLVVEGNGSPDQIGRAALFDGSIANCVHQNHLIRVRPGELVDPRFLGLVWNAPSTVAQLVAVASSTSGLHTLSTGKVKGVKLALPSLEEQHRLVAEAERRLSIVEAVLASVVEHRAKAERLRRALLAEAFIGRLVPQDSADEPADVLLERIRAARSKEGGATPGGRVVRKERAS